jgi:hypothetical protein
MSPGFVPTAPGEEKRCIHLHFAWKHGLGEELVSEKSRGDRTPLELFLAGIQELDAAMRVNPQYNDAEFATMREVKNRFDPR